MLELWEMQSIPLLPMILGQRWPGVEASDRVLSMGQIVLYVDLRPGQTCHFKVRHRKEVTHSYGSYGKKSRRRAWLTIWDKLKSQCTVID